VPALIWAVVASWALLLASPGWAQTDPAYPTRAVRIVVPYPAGGPTDVLARLIGQKLAERLGQSFVVENVSGASGAVGASAVANSAPDGHTMIFVTNDLAVAPTVGKVSYDPVRSFAPVTIVAASPQAVVVHPSVPAGTMQELAALLKAAPEKYTYGSLGLGLGQLSSQRLFHLGLGLPQVVRVPFQGAAPVITSTIAGHTLIGMLGLPPVAPHVKEGTLRLLAVTSGKRSPAFPEVPTMAEAGFPGQDSELIIGALVPAGTPKPVVDLLNRQIGQIVALSEIAARLDALGFSPVVNSPDDYAAYIKADVETWSKVVRDLGIPVP
jgi:tripartite-type tricarboxylate transporter receptor subunit TctC